MPKPMHSPIGPTPNRLQSTLASPAIEEWPSDSMEPAISFGDLIRVTPTRGIESDGMYMLHYQRGQIQPPAAQQLVAPLVKVIRRVRRLEDGRLHLSYDGAGYQCDEVVQEADLMRWCTVVGQVSVAQHNGRGFGQTDSAPPLQSSASPFHLDHNPNH